MSKDESDKKIKVAERYEGATPEMLGRALLRPRQPKPKQRESKTNSESVKECLTIAQSKKR